MKIPNAVQFYVITALLMCSALTCSAADAIGGNMSVSVGQMETKDVEVVMYNDKNCPYARVRRGRDWSGGDEDGGNGGLGTVIDVIYVDGEIVEGFCGVEWDSDRGWMHPYKVGLEGIFNLYIVHEDHACPAYDNKQCPYTRVKRGRDWTAGGLRDQDGGVGNLGTIVGILYQEEVSCFVVWDGNEGVQYSYLIGVKRASYLCTVEADDQGVNEFVDGFDIDAFITSKTTYYWSPEESIIEKKNSTDQVNTATLLQLETLYILLVVWTTVCSL